MSSTTLESTADSLSRLGISASFASSAPKLHENLHLLSPDEIELAKMLVEMGQSHVFDHWAEPGFDDEEKKGFFDQVARLNSSYPGGLESYIKTARELLADSKAGKNPFDGFTPSVPKGEILTFGDEKFINFEESGVREARKTAFVLVAGGLGERLGYNGIKVALPAETTTGSGFLQQYIESILALQEASGRLAQGDCQTRIPLVIMTSDDTHTRTAELLESNSYFGMEPTQVKLLKQEKVACLDDNDARLAVEPRNKYRIQARCWFEMGSVFPRYKWTSIQGRTMVINVEYNQLDPLLRATGHDDGDVNDETGYSPFPGNINQLILELGPYIEELTKTGGAIKEFVNPKYKDASKTSFKSSTRLECMMQDYPKTLPPTARVGFTVMDAWLAYAPVKNNPEDAAKVPKGNPYHSATSGEMAIYRANSLILKKAGAQVADPVVQVFNGQEVEVWPRTTWKPKWGLTFAEIKRKVCGSCTISQRSTMVMKGRDVFLEDLSLDGVLLIDAVDDAKVKVRGSVQNKGWILENIDYKDASVPEELRIRGFRINKIEQLEKIYTEPGEFCVEP